MQVCQNCGKEFPEEKIATHFGYCRRNIRKCQCGEFYDINFRQEHEQQFHKKTPCPHCKNSFPQAELDRHINNCTKKPKVCEYCELSVPVGEFPVHLRACQARTKPCEKCKKSIMNKDYFTHLVSCEGIVKPLPKANSPLESQTHLIKKREQGQKPYVNINYKPEKGTREQKFSNFDRRQYEQKEIPKRNEKQVKPRRSDPPKQEVKKEEKKNTNVEYNTSNRRGNGIQKPISGFQKRENQKHIRQEKYGPSKYVPQTHFTYHPKKQEQIKQKRVPTDKRPHPKILQKPENINEVQKKEDRPLDLDIGIDGDQELQRAISESIALEKERARKRQRDRHAEKERQRREKQKPKVNLMQIDEDEELQRALLESIGKSQKSKQLPPQFRQEDFMNESFYGDMDFERQMAMMHEIENKKRKR